MGGGCFRLSLVPRNFLFTMRSGTTRAHQRKMAKSFSARSRHFERIPALSLMDRWAELPEPPHGPEAVHPCRYRHEPQTGDPCHCCGRAAGRFGAVASAGVSALRRRTGSGATPTPRPQRGGAPSGSRARLRFRAVLGMGPVSGSGSRVVR